MKAFLAMACVTAFITVPVYADCPYPQAPGKLPDGATATLEEMIAGQKTVQAYEKAINEYNACIDKALEQQITQKGDQLKPEDKTKMQQLEAQKHNAAVDQLQSVADRFNEQVKIYKARNADKKG